METNNQYQPINTSSMRGNSMGGFSYDIEAEKQRIVLGTEEIKKELQERFNKKYANAQIFPAAIAAMHPDVVDFLLSFNLVAAYDNIAKQVGLDAKGRNALPKIVWQISQTKNWDGLDQILESQIQLVHSAHVTVANLLQQNILNKARMLSEKPFVKKVSEAGEIKKQNMQLALTDALNKYSNLGEQNITSNQLKLRYFPTPVRPSIKNWITDYHDNFGAGKHSPIDRGNFLFHSENGKTLSAFDRQRLGTVLKSLDENGLLTIDPDAQKIVFENTPDTGNARNENAINMEKPSNLGAVQSFGTANAVDARVPQSFNRPVAEKIQSANFMNTSKSSFVQPPRQDISSVRNNPMPPRYAQQNDKKNVERPQNFGGANMGRMEVPTPRANVNLREGAATPSNMNAVQPSVVKEAAEDNFFQLPTSKPPLGSDSFNAEEKNVFGSEKAGLQQKENVSIAGNFASQQDPDYLSDEMLFKKLQEKKIKANIAQSVGNAGGGNFTPKSNLSFSSPQRFAVEQKTSPAAQSPYHISPTFGEIKEEDVVPKIQKNVVDLKN